MASLERLDERIPSAAATAASLMRLIPALSVMMTIRLVGAQQLMFVGASILVSEFLVSVFPESARDD